MKEPKLFISAETICPVCQGTGKIKYKILDAETRNMFGQMYIVKRKMGIRSKIIIQEITKLTGITPDRIFAWARKWSKNNI